MLIKSLELKDNKKSIKFVKKKSPKQHKTQHKDIEIKSP